MVCARNLILSSCLAASFFSTGTPAAAEPAGGRILSRTRWLSDYGNAIAKAERRNKMLLVYFYDSGSESQCDRFEQETLNDRQVRAEMRNYICVRMPIDAKIKVQGKQVALLEHEAFREMLCKPGIAIVDYRSKGALRGRLVSAFPLTDSLWYTPEQMKVILTLPRGTITQRTLIYAVRIHPEHPASTNGEPNPELLEEAEGHAQYQAAIRVQGHQGWGTRFARILSRLPGSRGPREVCAESWAGQNLVDAAIECVRCWRTSSGHWSAVSTQSNYFGYDMKLGDNGVWYATGIVDGG